MIHWTTAAVWCFMSGMAGFFVAAALNMANDERRNNP